MKTLTTELTALLWAAHPCSAERWNELLAQVKRTAQHLQRKEKYNPELAFAVALLVALD